MPHVRAVPAWLLLCSTLAWFAPGCVRTEQTRIERGEVLATGQERFDQFFEDVLALQTESKTAALERRKAEARLREAIEVKQAGPDAAIEGARGKAKELKEQGWLLHLQLTPGVHLVTSKAHARVPSSAALEPLSKGVEQSVRDALTLAGALSVFGVKAEALERRRLSLRGDASAAFADATKRAAVEAELDASKELLERARAEGERQAGLASVWVIELASALETGGAGKPGKPPALPPTTRATTTGPKPPGGGSPAPPPAAPKKPPPKGSDFDP
jgi:hypothetical protein